MALDKQNEIFLELQKLNLQVGRLVSDFDSEKEVRRRVHQDYENRLKSLELWRSELQGRIVVIVSVATIIIGGIVTLIIKFVK